MTVTEKEFIAVLNRETRRIQDALFSVGYYAHTVKFFPNNPGGNLPRLEIEARPGDETDRERDGY